MEINEPTLKQGLVRDDIEGHLLEPYVKATLLQRFCANILEVFIFWNVSPSVHK